MTQLLMFEKKLGMKFWIGTSIFNFTLVVNSTFSTILP